MRSKFFILLAVSLSFFSCHEVDTHELYEKQDGDNLYTFSVDMSDSLSSYDLSFYTSLMSEEVSKDGFFMDLEWFSPSGEVLGERVFFDCSKGLVSPYRIDCRPLERGVWTLKAWAGTENIFGLGLIISKAHGTR